MATPTSSASRRPSGPASAPRSEPRQPSPASLSVAGAAPRLQRSRTTGPGSATYKGRAMLFAQQRQVQPRPRVRSRRERQSVGYVGASDGGRTSPRTGTMTWTYDSDRPGQRRRDGRVRTRRRARPDRARLRGAGPRRPRSRCRPPLAGTLRCRLGRLRRRLGAASCARAPAPDDVARGARGLYLGFGGRAPDASGPHDARAPPWPACRSRGATPATTSAATTSSGRAIWSSRREHSWPSVRDGSARRTLAYLVATQEPDGHWVQNQWVDGVAYWDGVQLDEAAYPILLAGALAAGAARPHARPVRPSRRVRAPRHRGGARSDDVDGRRVHRSDGPVTEQDRWEENAGLTPSTLAPVVAALVVAADYLPGRARDLLPGARRRLERVNRGLDICDRHAPCPRHSASMGTTSGSLRRPSWAARPISTQVPIRNRPSGESSVAGRRRWSGPTSWRSSGSACAGADDPRILSTLAVADGLLRTETPSGPVWHRYNGDGYGEHADGSPYDGTGVGRGWPLLVGERGHYELECGARRPAVPRSDAGLSGLVGRHAAGAGLGRRRHPGSRSVSRPSERLRDAPRLGPRGVHQARPLDGTRPRHRPAGGGLARGTRGPSPTRRERRGGSRHRARRWSPAGRYGRDARPGRVHCSLDG